MQNNGELIALQRKYNDLLIAFEAERKKNAALEQSLTNVKANFYSLKETARAELDRKDGQIQELRKERDNKAFRRGGVGPQSGPVPKAQNEAEKVAERPPRGQEKKTLATERPGSNRRERSRSRDSGTRRRSRSRERRRSRDRRHESTRKSRERSRDRQRSRRTSRDRERSHTDRSQDERRPPLRDEVSSGKRRNERTGSHSKSSSPSRDHNQPEKRQRLEKDPPPDLDVTVALEVKTELDQGQVVDISTPSPTTNEPQLSDRQADAPPPPLPMEMEPKIERPPEPLLTSFTGSLERLKKEGMLINTDRVLATPSSSVTNSSPIPSPLNPATEQLAGETAEQSAEMAENTLQISQEIKSSPASRGTPKTSPSASFELPTSPVANVQPESALSKVPQCHPHMNPMPGQDHLPMMVIPREAVDEPPLPEVPLAVERQPTPPPPPPPPKPKIQMKAGTRAPYSMDVEEAEAEQAKKPSSLTVDNLKLVNEEQEKTHLEFLRKEFLRVGGPEVANNPALVKSFQQKEKEQERRDEKQKVQDMEEEEVASSRGMPTHLFMSTTAVEGKDQPTPASVEQQPVDVDDQQVTSTTGKIEKENTSETHSQAEKCIIMGHSQYNYMKDEQGNRIMVVSRLKKKKRASSIPK